MKKLIFASIAIAAGFLLAAEADEAKLRASMKQIGPTCAGLGKKLTAKDPTAVADAKHLSEWFNKDVHKFWKAKNAADGVTNAKTASAEFKAVSKFASQGKWDEATASFKKATAQCAACHKAHREKAADGSWKVK